MPQSGQVLATSGSVESWAHLAVPSDEASHAETPESIERHSVSVQTQRYVCSVCDVSTVDMGTCMGSNVEMHDVDSQTTVHLPNTQTNVLWHPTCLSPIIDAVSELATEDSVDSDDEVFTGPGVDDIDFMGIEGDTTVDSSVVGVDIVGDGGHESTEPPRTCDLGILPESLGDVVFTQFGESKTQGNPTPIFKSEHFDSISETTLQNQDGESKSSENFHFDNVKAVFTFIWMMLMVMTQVSKGESAEIEPEIVGDDFHELTEYLEGSEEISKVELGFVGIFMNWIYKVLGTNPDSKLFIGTEPSVHDSLKIGIDIDSLPDKAESAKPRYVMRNGKRVRLRRGVTVDSGAASNVMPRRMVRNKQKIRPSAASIRGVHYIAANNGRIANEGEVDFEFITEEGHYEMMVMQIAEVNKALGSVSYMTDMGYRVIFDRDEKTGVDMSRMEHKATGRTTRFRREKNIWVLDAYAKDGEIISEPFVRQP